MEFIEHPPAVQTFASSLGPVLGGALSQHAGWWLYLLAPGSTLQPLPPPNRVLAPGKNLV